jgi:catechol 2,3-dioxygenase-like lactoylglutathione lyase family enzyme
VIAACLLPAAAPAQSLPTPEFHHLHLNSANPEAAIDFYIEQLPFTSRSSFAGEPALWSPTDVLILFRRAETPPPTQPQSAFWHFGWHVADVHQSAEGFRRNGVTLLPLYTERNGPTVFSSGDTWPGSGGVGLTAAEIAEAKANGVQPTNGAGFAYLRGPDDAIVEYQGNRSQERFNHVHLFMEQPFCALLWYERHLNVPSRGSGEPRTEADCRVARGSDPSWPALDAEGTFRTPSMNSIAFGDVGLFAYMNQTDSPLASTRGQLMDHFALRVEDLDAWIAKLRSEGVTFLETPYTVGDHRAVMIEGPSREAIELIEVAP